MATNQRDSRSKTIRHGEEFLSLGIRGVEITEREVGKFEAEDETQYCLRLAMLLFFAKAAKTYRALRLLWTNGFQEDSFVLARTLFELLLNVRFVAEDDSRARLYLDFDSVDRYRAHLRLKEFGEAPDEADVKQLKDQYERVKDQYDRGGNWWGKYLREECGETGGVKGLATHLGKVTLEEYLKLYWQSSGLTHSAVVTMRSYVAEPSDQEASIAVMSHALEPSDTMIVEFATLYVLETAHIVCAAFGKNVDDEMKELAESFGKLQKTHGS